MTSVLTPTQLALLQQTITDKKMPHILISPTGSGKTIMSTLMTALSIDTRGRPHIILFVSMNRICVNDHSKILNSISNELAKDPNLNVGIANLSANVFWRFWKKDPSSGKTAYIMHDDEKKPFVTLFNTLLASAEVTIILDEVHLTVSNSLPAKVKKMQWLKENFPQIRVLGVTATITALPGSDREKRLISYFAPGSDSIDYLQMTEEQETAIPNELPFTSTATTKKLSGSGVKDLAGNEVADALHFLLCLHTMATQVEGFAVPDVQKVITNLLLDFSADTWVANLIDAVKVSQTVEVHECTRLANFDTSDAVNFCKIESGADVITKLKSLLTSMTIDEEDEGEEAEENELPIEEVVEEEDADDKAAEEKQLSTGSNGSRIRGRIIIISGDCNKNLLKGLIQKLKYALDEQKNEAGGIKKCEVVDATCSSLEGEKMDEILELAWKKNVVFVVVGKELMTGINLMVGFADTTAEYGKLSDSAHKQFMGRVSNRPVSHGTKPAKTWNYPMDSPVLEKLITYFQVRERPMKKTRKRLCDEEEGKEEPFEDMTKRIMAKFPFPSIFKSKKYDNSMMRSIKEDPKQARKMLDAIKEPLKYEEEEEEEEEEDEVVENAVDDETRGRGHGVDETKIDDSELLLPPVA